MDKYDLFENALSLIKEKHFGQVDLGGEPYKYHLYRVAENFNMYYEFDEKIVSLLHDIMEDTDITVNDLLDMGFSSSQVLAVQTLTKIKDESYEDYINRILKNKIAIKVKIKDIEDNANILRLKSIEEKDIKRLKKYHKFYKILIKKHYG